MQITLLVVLLGLLSLHAAAELDDDVAASTAKRCSKMCMKYAKCLQNHESGSPDVKTCIQPPCKCDLSKPVVEVPKPEQCMGPECPKMVSVDEMNQNCDGACMRYSKCMAEGSAGCMMLKGDCKCSEGMDAPCMGPRCPNVAPVVEIIPRCESACLFYSQCRTEGSMNCMKPTGCMCMEMSEMALKPKRPRDKCFLVCKDYKKCMRESMTNPNPSQACVKSKECEECSAQPEMALKPKRPRDKCFLVCKDYKKCMRESMTNPNPGQACVKSKECEACSAQPEGMDEPCMGPNCPNVAPVEGIVFRCESACLFYSQCRAEGSMNCMKPTGCMCMEMSEMVLKPRRPREKCFLVCLDYKNCMFEQMTNPNPSQACVRSKDCVECSRQVDPMPVVPKPMPVEPKPMPVEPKPMPVVPVEDNMCSNEKCAEFWMCTWMAPRDEKLSCVKPSGCKCDCVAAGICAAPHNPEIARNSEPWAGEDDLHMPLMPGRGHMGMRRCQQRCSMYRLCNQMMVNPGVDRPSCMEPVGCNCGRFP